eukprot:6231397-Lingulodinium_polyedra.AAC.1
MVTRTVMLVLYMCAKNCGWMVEQPSSSLMHLHPRMVMLRNLSKAHKGIGYNEIKTNMGAFGARTRKPTNLFSGEAWLPKLARKLPKGFQGDSSGVTSVHGGAVTGGPRLKETQAYTPELGVAIVEGYKRRAECIDIPSSEDESIVTNQEDEDTW